MPLSILPSFLIYCYIGAITPGPANLCSLSAALRYGRGPALRQWRGMVVGFTCISLASVAATYLLGTLLNEYVGVLSWFGAAYLLWMAWHTLLSSEGGLQKDASAPTFLTGLLVQLTNVKVMVFCLVALSSFVLPYTSKLLPLLRLAPLRKPSCVHLYKSEKDLLSVNGKQLVLLFCPDMKETSHSLLTNGNAGDKLKPASREGNFISERGRV